MLDCTVKANPAPMYTWDHLKEKNSSSVLKSSALSLGNYTCTATNTLGRDSKVFIVKDGCPILLSPLDVVVEYGASFSVNCSYSATHQFGLSWDGFDDTVEESEEIFRFVDKVTDWETNLTCYMSSNETQCSQDLPITIYKTPDSVFISTVNHRGPMTEGQQYELQCDVYNVAPVQNLTVKWYKGQTLLHQTNFTDTTETPVNETVTLLIRPDRADDGAQYWCEAELDLGAEGPQPHPTNSSNPLSIAVYYKPKHSNSTETIIQDDKVMLDCTVKANPAPTYTWDHLKEKNSSSVLKSSALSLGNYTCTATNTLGRDSKVFIVKDGCPILLSPLDVVVEYGASFSVNCSYSATHQFGLSWDGFDGTVEESEE
uniref:Ig-like domain-containing protein n=1 Tax=Cyprinus carpio carpio TaxID=630221 RepID=A0A8C1HVV1_CYPCA